MRAARTFAFLLSLISPAEANALDPAVFAQNEQVGEGYRLRIANTEQGGVDISTDGGATWLLVARVVRPATRTAPGAATTLPVVERVSMHGLAFGVGGGRLVRLLPNSASARRDPTAITVNVPETATLFKDLLPPRDSPVQQYLRNHTEPLPTGYTPQDGDVLLLSAPRVEIPADRLAAYARDAAERYRDSVLGRLRAQGRKPTSGQLTVNAALPPDLAPSAVTFALDGTVNAILNAAPYTVRWNTRDWQDGEHLVEVRALDATGRIIRQTKVLVVVDNSP